MQKKPNVLVISPCTFNLENGGGTTFTNLFSGWPREKLANLHMSDQVASSEVCGSFYRMGQAEIQKSKIFGWAPPLKSIETSSNSLGKEKISFLQRLKSKAVGNSGWPSHFHFSPALETWLENFQPQVIYTILGPIPFLEAILQIQKRYSAKLILHHMDDWYATAYTSGLFSYQNGYMKKLFRQITELANHHWTICDAMSHSYQSRFGKTYTSFHNAISVTDFESKITQWKRPTKSSRRLLYFGSVLPFSQEKSLLQVIDSVSELNQEQYSCEIRVVAPKSQWESIKSKRPELNGGPIDGSSDQFPKEIAQSDALLLPSNFDEEATSFLRYSMPTKIPGFLASGNPILVYAPHELAQVQYAIKENWAITCTEETPSTLKEKIRQLFSEETRSIAKEKNPMLARKNHDIQTVRLKFQEAICSLN